MPTRLGSKNPQITDLIREDFSRKGAKAQSAAAFQKDFLCAFAGEIFCVICGWGYLLLSREAVTERFRYRFRFGVYLQLFVDVTQVKLDGID